jgi:hypothetical protein
VLVIESFVDGLAAATKQDAVAYGRGARCSIAILGRKPWIGSSPRHGVMLPPIMDPIAAIHAGLDLSP